MSYTAHLAKDENPNLTACGEPWQGWQEPFDADLHGAGPTQPPMFPPSRGTAVRQCQACLRVAMASPCPQAGQPQADCQSPNSGGVSG